jgi:DNA-binding GntR family transcriptional regulator
MSAPYIRQYIASSNRMVAAQRAHRRILAACARADGVVAQREVERHLRAVGAGALAKRPRPSRTP